MTSNHLILLLLLAFLLLAGVAAGLTREPPVCDTTEETT